MIRYQGGWRGVVCSGFRTARNDTGNYYTVSVTSLILYGSSMSCELSYESFGIPNQCGFDGIQGALPSDIGGLTNLDTLTLKHHPKLTGAVPLQIWQMPNLTSLQLVNNSLEGTLPCSSSLSSTLAIIDLRSNQFTGKLEVSLEGTLFSSSLRYLDLSSNHMFGELNLQRLSLVGPEFRSLDLRYNNFNGTFSTGHYFNPGGMFLSNNSFTRIKFSNYSGNATGQGFRNAALKDVGIIYMPALQAFEASDNQLGGSFPMEILLKPRLSSLDVSGNHFSGSLDFPNFPFVFNNLQIISAEINLMAIFSSGPYLNPWILDISHNQFKHINFDSYNGSLDVSMPMLENLYMGNNKATSEFPMHILKAPMLNALYADHNL